MPPLSYRLTMVYVWTEGRGRLPAGSDRARLTMGKPLYPIWSTGLCTRKLSLTNFYRVPIDIKKLEKEKGHGKLGESHGI